jgi:hypothetical protein
MINILSVFMVQEYDQIAGKNRYIKKNNNMMINKVLKFEEFNKLSESYEKKGENAPEIDLELTPEKMQSLIQQLAKVGITKNTPGKFKFVDNEGMEYMLMMTPTGEVEIIGEMIEGIKDKLITGVICTMLASGLVSCQKDTQGFGYNVSSRATVHKLGQGVKNKKITISTPWGEEEHEVDSNLAVTRWWSAGSGMKIKRPMTPTEAYIIKAGQAYGTEKNMNNKKGTDPNTRWDYDPSLSTITGGGYEDAVPMESCREHPFWKQGLEILRKEGKDVDGLIRKADQELANKIYF